MSDCILSWLSEYPYVYIYIYIHVCVCVCVCVCVEVFTAGVAVWRPASGFRTKT
jgi:hypothetical protein